MRDREHPTAELLNRFQRGETTQSETLAVVRHLVGGCPQCTAVTRPVWITVDRLCASPANEERERREAREIALVRERLHVEVEHLKASRRRLAVLHNDIRRSELETSDEDIDADPDVATEMRAVIANGLRDCLDPLIRDLREAARYQPSTVRKGEPERMREENNGKKGKEARERLRGLLAESEALRDRLSALRESIPPSLEERAEKNLPEHPDVATQIRAAIGALLCDHLDPMIEVLIATVAYQPQLRWRA